MYNVFNVLSLLWKHNTFLFVYCTLFNNIYLGIYLYKNNKTNKQTKQTKNGRKERKKVKKEGFEAALEPSTFGCKNRAKNSWLFLKSHAKKSCPLNRQQKRASCLATLCCKTSWKVKSRSLSPTFNVTCVNTNFWLDNFTRATRHTRDACPLIQTFAKSR